MKLLDTLCSPVRGLFASHSKDTPLPTAVSVGATKRDPAMWQFYIDVTENELAQETNPTRRKNIKVCLDYIRAHGYPDRTYKIWAIDGEVLCQTNEEWEVTWRTKGLAPRRLETYAVV